MAKRGSLVGRWVLPPYSNSLKGLGFGVWGLGFRVLGLGLLIRA